MRIKLHVGLHKTATTSIQKSLARNRDLLEENGWSYPVIKDEVEKAFPNHAMPFYAAFFETYANRPQLLARGYEQSWARPLFRDKLAQAIEGKERVLFSGEGISFFSNEELESVKAFFADRSATLEPVCFIRSPFEMATSGLQENIKHGHKFVLKPVRKFEAIEKLKTSLGELQTYPFEEAKRHPSGPVGFFIETLGLGDPADFKIFRQNETMSDRATRLIGFVNRLLPISANKQLNTARFYDDARPLWELPGRKFTFTEAEKNVLSDRVMEENERYLETLGAEYCDNTDEKGPETSDNWSPEATDFVIKALPDLNPALWPAVCLYLDLNPQIPTALSEPVLEEVLRLTPDRAEAVEPGLAFHENALETAPRFLFLATGTRLHQDDVAQAVQRIDARIDAACRQA